MYHTLVSVDITYQSLLTMVVYTTRIAVRRYK